MSAAPFTAPLRHSQFLFDIHNPTDLLSAILTFGAFLLNMCTENILKEGTFFHDITPSMCTSTVTAPLAGRELLSFAVLINWLKLTRLLRLHKVLGPLLPAVASPM